MSFANTHGRRFSLRNFDDLIEDAYRSADKKAQDVCYPIFVNTFSRRETDYINTVSLFRLMGSVSRRDDESRMALSRSDYNRKLQQRTGLFRLLKDYVQNGTVVYVGYSFQDNIARDVVEEISRETSGKLPASYAIIPQVDRRTRSFLEANNIHPVQMTFEDFVDALEQQTEESVKTQSDLAITVNGVTNRVSENLARMYRLNFEFMHDEIGEADIDYTRQTKRNFIEGVYFILDWDTTGLGI